jgi:small neutral amino acid transporter SnatA (MarC family)
MRHGRNSEVPTCGKSDELAIALDVGEGAGSMPFVSNYRRIFARLAFAASLSVFLLPAGLLAGQGLAPLNPSRTFTVSITEMFTFLFLMLGPIKILGPFVQMTRKGDPAFAKRLAIRAFLYSCAALLFVAFIGERSMRKYHISVPVLAIAAGIILFLVALQTVMQQFDTSGAAGRLEYEPSMRLAVSPLAFPTIVTPYGVAAVIVFMTLTPDLVTRGEIFAALLGLMLLNLVAMLFAKQVLKYAGMPMQLLGTVLGIIQVALGLQIIVMGLRGLGLLSAG